MTYRRSNSDWFSGSVGATVHWTSSSKPLQGPPLDYQAKVEDFDVDGFIAQLRQCRVKHLIFTLTHAKQFLAAPIVELEEILPGRTARRDLIGELAESLNKNNIRLICYYNHSCNRGDDPEWEKAAGYMPEHNLDDFAGRILNIVGAVSRRYGKLISGWWFDSSYAVSADGPHCTVSFDLKGWQFPWQRLNEAAKAGNADSLVTFNAGVDVHYSYSDFQDYYAGETASLDEPIPGRFEPDGRFFHHWTCLDNRKWVHCLADTPFAAPLYTDEALQAFINKHTSVGAAVSFNLEIEQGGTINQLAVDQLSRMRF